MKHREKRAKMLSAGSLQIFKKFLAA